MQSFHVPPTDVYSDTPAPGGSDPFSQFFDKLMHYTSLLEKRCQLLEQQVTHMPGAEPGAQEATYNPAKDALQRRQPDLSAIQPLLDDHDINDILINGPHEIFIERQGNIIKTDFSFKDDEALLQFANEIVSAVGRKLDVNKPLVDARLPDGSRVNIIAPPLSIDGITISIRKFGRGEYNLDRLAETGSMSQQIADFLKVCASAKVNIVVSGGTGSGKTTLLNAIAEHIRPTDRIVTIEDSAELRLPLPHVVRLEAMESDELGRKQVPMRDLVKNALRMRPDRIIIGEVRGPEAFDMIQAMNTGHEGSLTTVHANTPRDSLSRIENMIGMANLNLPPASIRKQMASALNFVIQVARLEDGSRRLQKISEVVGMEGEVVVMQDIFSFKQTGHDEQGRVKGQFLWSNIFPKHRELNLALREAGMLSLVGDKKG